MADRQRERGGVERRRWSRQKRMGRGERTRDLQSLGMVIFMLWE